MPINCVSTFIVLLLSLLKFPSAKSHRGVLEMSFIASELLKREGCCSIKDQQLQDAAGIRYGLKEL